MRAMRVARAGSWQVAGENFVVNLAWQGNLGLTFSV